MAFASAYTHADVLETRKLLEDGVEIAILGRRHE
jgi:hypothetical protein